MEYIKDSIQVPTTEFFKILSFKILVVQIHVISNEVNATS